MIYRRVKNAPSQKKNIKTFEKSIICLNTFRTSSIAIIPTIKPGQKEDLNSRPVLIFIFLGQ